MEPNEVTSEDASAEEHDQPPIEIFGVDKLTASDESADLAAELEDHKDRLLRLQAEMQNVRQRTSREVADERRYGALPVLRGLLPVVDNVDRAIEAAGQNSDADSLLEGFRLVRQQLESVLTQHNCELIDAEGAEFDPDMHEAILQQPSEDIPAGAVTMVTQTGYRLHDRVVRAPQVIVSSGPSSQE